MSYKLNFMSRSQDLYDIVHTIYGFDGYTLFHHSIFAATIELTDSLGDGSNPETKVVENLTNILENLQVSEEFYDWEQQNPTITITKRWYVFINQVVLMPIATLTLEFQSESHAMVFKLRWI